jgi:hypothetical protein
VVMVGIGTGSACNVARLCGNLIGFPRIGEAEGDSKGVITCLLGLLAELVGFVTGLGVGLEFKLSFRDPAGIVSSCLGKKHDFILTADASGMSKFRVLLLRALLFSMAAVVEGGSRAPGTKGVTRGGGGVIYRPLPH